MVQEQLQVKTVLRLHCRTWPGLPGEKDSDPGLNGCKLRLQSGSMIAMERSQKLRSAETGPDFWLLAGWFSPRSKRDLDPKVTTRFSGWHCNGSPR